jgi:hypothetical protein
MIEFTLWNAMTRLVGEDDVARVVRLVREQRRLTGGVPEAGQEQAALPEGFRSWRDLPEEELCRLIG